MRCPKCGYISFDHLATCLNCSKDFSELTSSTIGTTYSATAPLFLKFPHREEREDDFAVDEMMQDDPDNDLDVVVDPDLDILIKDEDEGGIDFNSDDLSLKDEFGSSEDDFSFSLDEEPQDADSRHPAPEIDLSRFEEVSPESGMGGEEERLTISLPDELADISDLAAPAQGRREEPPAPARGSLDEGMDLDTLDFDLKLDGLDEDFSLTSQGKGGEEKGMVDLSLDDIDASLLGERSTPAPSPVSQAAPATRADLMDMDADLDFELDLGGLTIPRK